MYQFAFFLSAVGCAVGAALAEGLLPQLDGRIVGGSFASIDQLPWQVSLQRNGVHACGGAIISETSIITAAHCVQSIQAKSLKVRAGATAWNAKGQLVDVRTFRKHENFNAYTMANDIAIVRLNTPLKLNAAVRAIPLASSMPAHNAAAVVSGWGKTADGGQISTSLKSVAVQIVSKQTCASPAYGYGYEILGPMICAATAGGDACHGDSGGPLVAAGALVGIVSWGYGCADAQYPGVYTDVAALKTWVLQNVASM